MVFMIRVIQRAAAAENVVQQDDVELQLLENLLVRGEYIARHMLKRYSFCVLLIASAVLQFGIPVPLLMRRATGLIS